MEQEKQNEGEPLELRHAPACLYPTINAEDKLVFEYGSPGSRYYLNGEPLHAGTLLEMRLDDGAWETVRYEYTTDPASGKLCVHLCLRDDRHLPFSEQSVFRWLTE